MVCTRIVLTEESNNNGWLDRPDVALVDGGDLGRGLYESYRSLLNLRAVWRRRRAAGDIFSEADFTIPRDLGFARFEPGRFPEINAIVYEANRELEKLEPTRVVQPEVGTKGLFMGLFDCDRLTLDSPFIKFALRPDIVGAISAYLGVVPVLARIDLWYSAHASRQAIRTTLSVIRLDCCSTMTIPSGPDSVIGPREHSCSSIGIWSEQSERFRCAAARNSQGNWATKTQRHEGTAECRVENGEWRMENGKWRKGSRIWRKIEGRVLLFLSLFAILYFLVSWCLRGLNFGGRRSQRIADQSTADANETRSGNSAIGRAERVFSSPRRLIHTQGMFRSLHTEMS